MASFTAWRERAEAALDACRRLGGKSDPLTLERPATPDELREVERRLGLKLPASFRRVLTEFASAFEVAWFLPEGLEPPEPVSAIFGGDLSWDLDKLADLEAVRLDWVKEYYPNADDEYDCVWHNKLAIHEVGNGDMLALDLSNEHEAPLVYLGHGDGDGHGYVIGPSFEDAIDRWTLVGCVGSEDWQWLPFVSSPTSGIEPNCDAARKWREWFGLAV